MNCKTARSLFSLRIDDGLSYEEQRRLAEHLDGCPGCAKELRSLEKTVDLLHSLPQVTAPDTFLQDVLLAARQAQAEAPAVTRSPGILERVRGWLPSVVFEPAPRWAVAALTLGLIVGISGSMILFRGPAPLKTAQRVETAVAPQPVAEAAQEPAAATPAPMPSGPFEDLVHEMLQRVESAPSGNVDSTAVSGPEWGAGWDPAVRGQTVGFGPTRQRERGREGSVYIVF